MFVGKLFDYVSAYICICMWLYKNYMKFSAHPCIYMKASDVHPINDKPKYFSISFSFVAFLELFPYLYWCWLFLRYTTTLCSTDMPLYFNLSHSHLKGKHVTFLFFFQESTKSNYLRLGGTIVCILKWTTHKNVKTKGLGD